MDLSDCAKDLLVGAMASTGPGTKTFEIDQSFEPGAHNSRPPKTSPQPHVSHSGGLSA